MTTGSRTISSPTYQYFDGIGYLPSGRSCSKSWNGQDCDGTVLPPSGPKGYKSGRGKSRVKLPEHPYSMSLYDQTLPIIGIRPDGAQWASLTTSAGNFWGIETDVWDTWDRSQYYKLVSRIQKIAYGSEFNPAVFAAESGEALRMISNSAIRIGSALRRLRVGDLHGLFEALGIEPNAGFIASYRRRGAAVNSTKGLSQSWLELIYGWLPLLHDMEDGAHYIADVMTGAQKPSCIRVSRTWAEYRSCPTPAYTSGFQKVVDVRTLRIKVATWNAEPRYRPSWASAATVAWELMPWSFVFDWAVPVGPYLETMRTASSISGEFTTSHTLVRTGTDWGLPGPVTVVGILGDPPKRQDVHYSRSVSTELLVPPPAQVKSVEKILSPLHAVNAVALLVSGSIEKLDDLFRASAKRRL